MFKIIYYLLPFIVWTTMAAPTYAALCNPVGGGGLLNQPWPQEVEVVVRVGGHREGEADKAWAVLNPYLETITGLRHLEWRFAEPLEPANLSLVVFRTGAEELRKSAVDTIESFFHDNAKERDEFIDQLKAEPNRYRFKISAPKKSIDLMKKDDGSSNGTLTINLDDYFTAAERIVAIPISSKGKTSKAGIYRGLMLGFAGANDIFNAVDCETYSGVMTDLSRTNLSEDDLKLLGVE